MKQELKKLLSITHDKFKKRFFGLVLMTLVASTIELVGLGALPVFVMLLTNPDKLLEYPVFESFISASAFEGNQLLFWGGGILFTLYLLKNFFLSLVQYFKVQLVASLTRYYSKNLFKTFLRSQYGQHSKENSSVWIHSITVDSKILAGQIIGNLFAIILNLILALGVVGILVYSSSMIALISIGVLGGAGLIIVRTLQSQMRKIGVAAQKSNQACIRYTNEAIEGFKEVKVFGREGYFLDQFKNHILKFTRSEAMRNFIGSLSNNVLEQLAISALLSILFILIWTGHTKESVIPLLTLFAAGIVRLRGYIATILNNYSNLKYSLAAISPVYTAWHTPKEKNQASDSLSFTNEVRIKDLSFSYSEKSPVLDNLNFHFNRGECLGIIGPSGAGKSTLMDLLLGLYAPQTGDIETDGKSIFNNLNAWRKLIGYVPQDVFLTEGTLATNITLSNDYDLEQIKKVIEISKLKEFVESLEDGLDTNVGERGTQISGGQKQRVGIARALYHNPQLLLMDEPTSSLDQETEEAFFESLNSLKQSLTILVIAHNPKIEEYCDRILKIQDGKILVHSMDRDSENSRVRL